MTWTAPPERVAVDSTASGDLPYAALGCIGLGFATSPVRHLRDASGYVGDDTGDHDVNCRGIHLTLVVMNASFQVFGQWDLPEGPRKGTLAVIEVVTATARPTDPRAAGLVRGPGEACSTCRTP